MNHAVPRRSASQDHESRAVMHIASIGPMGERDAALTSVTAGDVCADWTLTANARRLRSIPLFRELPAGQLNAYAGRCQVVHLKRHERLAAARAGSRSVLFVVDGRVRIEHIAFNGQEVVVCERNAGEGFGSILGIDVEGTALDVVATCDTRLLDMHEDDYCRLLESLGERLVVALDSLGSVVTMLAQRLVEFATMDVHRRVCAELLRLVEEATGAPAVEHEYDRGVKLLTSPTHAELAARIGSQREAVTRELRRLQQLGLLDYSRKCWFVRDVPRLRGILAGAGQKPRSCGRVSSPPT